MNTNNSREIERLIKLQKMNVEYRGYCIKKGGTYYV